MKKKIIMIIIIGVLVCTQTFNIVVATDEGNTLGEVTDTKSDEIENKSNEVVDESDDIADEKQPSQEMLSSSATYNVTQSNFDAVVAGIKLSNRNENILVLGEDIASATPFAGILNKHITLKSIGDNCFSINMGSDLVGDITLDSVTAYNENSKIFANGNRFETTSNFRSKKDSSGIERIKYLYGGGNTGKDVQGDTTLIIRGGNFSWIYGGGYESSVSGNTNILVDTNKDNFIGNLRGGGYAEKTVSGTVGGNTNLTLRQGKVASLYGGGENQTSKDKDRTPARVFGNVNITTGYVGASEASMWIGSATDSNGGSIKSTVTNVNFSMLEGTINYGLKSDGSYNGGLVDTQGAGYCDDVLGVINISVENARIDTLNGSGCATHRATEAEKADGYHSRVLNQDNKENAIHILWNNRPAIDAKENGGIVGTGYQYNTDYIKGNVLIEFKNGNVDFIEATQFSSGKDMSKLDGHFNVVMSGGRAAYIRGSADNYKESSQLFASELLFDSCKSSEVGYLYYMDEVKLVNKSTVLIDSEKFNQFSTVQSPFISVRNLTITEESKLTTRNSNTLLQNNVMINNGTWHALGNAYVYEKMESKDSYIFFDNYFALGYNHKNDADLTQFNAFESRNDEVVALKSGYTGKIYGNADLNESDIGFLCPVNVSGNWLGGDSLLRVPAVVTNYDGTATGGKIAVNIDGIASGQTKVMTVEENDSKTLKNPKLGDNYITGYKVDKNTPIEEVFVLGNEEVVNEGYYLKRVSEPTNEENYFMWQVAKKDAYSVGYVFVSGTKGMGLPDEVKGLLPTDSEKYIAGSAVEAIKPTVENISVTNGVWTFSGWDMDSKVVTGNITFTGTWVFVRNADIINHPPVVNASDKIYFVGDEHDPMSNVIATDKEDGVLTDKVEHFSCDVDTTTVGVYEDTFKVTDSKLSSAVKTVKITVIEKEYTVKFDTQGAGIIPDKTGLKYTSSNLLPMDNLTKDGYTFIGWKYGENIVTDMDTYENLAKDDTIMQIELVAQWEINKYTVDYEFVAENYPEGILVPNGEVVEHGSIIQEPAVATLDSWIFYG